ncbi:MAG: hypothetical protein WC421_09350 [Elusimicrobiales bacterium]
MEVPAPAAREAGFAPRSGDGDSAWSMSSFSSAADGLEISYKYRKGGGAKRQPPLVFIGGLSLQEVYETVFAVEGAPARDEYCLWMRAHSPTGWKYTRSLFDYDALDMARLINIAARESGSGKVTLVLHSYGTMLFQRMMQLGYNGDVAAAIGHLSGTRVILSNGVTHKNNVFVPQLWESYMMASNLDKFVLWLDGSDDYAEYWKHAAETNPAIAMPTNFNYAVWRVQRQNSIMAATKQGADMSIADLSEPWDDPDIEPVRASLLRTVRQNAVNPDWREALLRRSYNTSHANFDGNDMELLKNSGIRTVWVATTKDQLLPWASTKFLMQHLGMDAPKETPEAGSSFKNSEGTAEMRIFDGDHYFPLKHPREFLKLIYSDK